MSFKLRISFPKRPTKTSYYSAEQVGNNDDLLNQILLRLPIKSLLKFKSVSKHWLSLISNPNFSHRRSPFPTAASGLFLQTSRSCANSPEFNFVDFDPSSSSFVAPFKSLTFVNDLYGITIIQSCNGLLLCSTAFYSRRKSFYIYNPTTKHYTTLPPLSFPRGTFTWSVWDIVLAFDPSKSPNYKVVCLTICNNNDNNNVVVDDQFQIQIYSSETGPWRPCSVQVQPFSLSHLTNLVAISGVFCNGAIHWLNRYGTSLYFKVDEEKLYQMPSFPVVNNSDVINGDFKYVGESGDRLHAVICLNGITDNYLEVFEMEKDYSRWVLKFKVDLAEISNIIPEVIYDNTLLVLCFVVGGEVSEDSFLVLMIFDIVFRYDLKTGTFYKLCVNNHQPVWYEKNYQYIESLACV